MKERGCWLLPLVVMMALQVPSAIGSASAELALVASTL